MSLRGRSARWQRVRSRVARIPILHRHLRRRASAGRPRDSAHALRSRHRSTVRQTDTAVAAVLWRIIRGTPDLRTLLVCRGGCCELAVRIGPVVELRGWGRTGVARRGYARTSREFILRAQEPLIGLVRFVGVLIHRLWTRDKPQVRPRAGVRDVVFFA